MFKKKRKQEVFNTQPNLTPNEQEKELETKHKAYRRREKIKMRAEINNAEIKKTVEWNNETKSWFSKIIKKMYQALASLINEKRENLNK